MFIFLPDKFKIKWNDPFTVPSRAITFEWNNCEKSSPLVRYHILSICQKARAQTTRWLTCLKCTKANGKLSTKWNKDNIRELTIPWRRKGPVSPYKLLFFYVKIAHRWEIRRRTPSFHCTPQTENTIPCGCLMKFTVKWSCNVRKIILITHPPDDTFENDAFESIRQCS